MSIPTVRVFLKNNGTEMLINASDFDETLHDLRRVSPELPHEKKADEKEETKEDDGILKKRGRPRRVESPDHSIG